MKSQEVKPARKILPYSIKEVSGPEEVKAWQAASYAKSEARATERRQNAINALMGAQPTTNHANVWDEGKKVQDAFKADQQRQREEYDRIMAAPVVAPPKASLFTRIWTKLTNLFTNLPF